MLSIILWLVSWFVPTAVVNLFRNLRAMGAEPSPDMQAFVDMAAAAMQSKNAYIYDQCQRLDAAEDRARASDRALDEALQQITQLKLQLTGVESKLEEQREATATAMVEAQHAQQRAGELQQALTTTQAERDELNGILSLRESSYYALLQTIEEYMSVVDSSDPAQSENDMLLDEEAADLRLTPEKLAFWTTRLESAAKLRREVDWSTPVKASRSKLPSPGGGGSSGEENWHTPHTASRSLHTLKRGPFTQRSEGGSDVEADDRGAEQGPPLIKALHEG